MNRVLVVLAALMLVGCPDKTPPGLPPIDVGVDLGRDAALADDGDDAHDMATPSEVLIGEPHFALRWDPGTATLNLRRDAQTLLSFGRDGFQIGVVENLDPRINYDPYGFFTQRNLPPAPPLDEWRTISGFTVTASTATRLVAMLDFGADVTAELIVDYAGEGRFDASLTPVSGTSKIAFFRLSAAVDPTEAFYGLGEVFDDVDHRGHARAMQLEVQQGVESFNNEAHVPIPLLIGTTGWGLFVHDFHPGVFDVASVDDDRINAVFATTTESAQGLKFHLIAADHPLDVTRHYYDLTGYPVNPARWALGPWIWRDENEDQAQVVSDVNMIRDLDLATTAYWIDRPYATAVNTFDFSPAMFDDAQAMIDTMHDLGFRVALWHTPYLDESDPATAALRAEAIDNGYYPPRNGTPLNNWGKPIDLSNPDAYAWWQSNIQRYIDMGIEGFKLDYGEDVVVGLGQQRNVWEFANGLDERTMQALYQPYYHGAYAELLPATGGFLLCRRGTIGDQTRVSIIWPGDLDANMARHLDEVPDGNGGTYKAVGGLPAAIVAALSLGPAGYPLFGSDTGGYRHSPPNKETFVRWFQMTALSTVMQVGTSSNDVPWEFNARNGFDQESLDLYRQFARLHLRLFPYVWTYLQRLADDGRPIQRALGLAYPELGVHPNDEYLLGDHLFVAPVVEPGATTRDLTLPPGDWLDWWTGERLQGPGAKTVAAPLSTLPLYLSANGFVPLLRPTIDAIAPVVDASRVDSYATKAGRLHVRVAHGAVGSFEVFDGGVVSGVMDIDWALTSTTGAELNEGVMWEILGGTVTAVELDGSPLPSEADLDTVDRGWRVEGVLTHVLVPPGTHSITIR